MPRSTDGLWVRWVGLGYGVLVRLNAVGLRICAKRWERFARCGAGTRVHVTRCPFGHGGGVRATRGVGLEGWFAAGFRFVREVVVGAWRGSGVPDDTLAHANALSTIVSNLRLPLGGLVAAVFFALDDPALVFLSSGLFYAVSWVLLLGLPTPPAERSRDGARRSGRSLDQAPQVLKDPRLSASLGFVAGSNVLLVGAWIVGSPILAEQIAPGSGSYAFMQAAYGLGVVAGSLLVASLSGRSVAMRRVISGGYVVRALAFVGLVLAGSRLEATAGALLLGLATPALTVTFPTVLQRLSRVIGSAGTIFGLYGLANAGAISVSIMVYGLVATYLAPPGMFMLPAVASLVAAVLVYQLVVLRFVSDGGESGVSASVE